MILILKIIFVILSPILINILILMGDLFYLYVFKKMRFKDGFKRSKARSILKRLYIDFPMRFALDLFANDPFIFKEHGLHMFCGKQGSGKTISVCEMLITMKSKYPKVKIFTNMDYKKQDGSINHWKDIVNKNNGEYGCIMVLDEIQTWFSSLQSKDFPPEMITEVSQQRKQRKMLVGTAQVFSRIAKPIREQTTYVYCPITFFGCLTYVRVTYPEYWDDDKQRFKQYIRRYFYIHNDEIRNSFDTLKRINKYSKEGFQEGMNPVKFNAS